VPTRPKRPCNYPGCPELVEAGERYCPKHKKLISKQIDQRRGSSTQRGYNARWQRARKVFLQKNPLCVECLKEGNVTPATVVDHIVPHKGNYNLFWNESNWQSLCATHHNIKTAKENGGWGK
jgi:5-methylcytosine-specific restriction enzyme A